MAVRDILQLGNPVLWEKSARVASAFSEETNTLITDLADTLAAFREARGYGRAIAAPQIGALKRVIYVRMVPEGLCGPLINPEIVWEDSHRIELWDDCFSFPDLLVKVSRSARIRVQYEDARGRPVTLEASGDLSELLQHEIDHLDGILAVQRALSPRAFSTRAEWERQRRR